MTAWDRVNRIERDLAQAEARIRALEGEIRETCIVAGLEPFDGTTTHEKLRQAVQIAWRQRQNVEALSAQVHDLRDTASRYKAERDTARRIAVTLEQELAEAERVIDDLYGALNGDEDVDDQALAAALAALDIRTRRGD